MKFMNLYFDVNNGVLGKPYTKADVDLPGVGTIAIKDCLSKQTQEAIIKEVIAVAKKRLEQGMSNTEE